MSFCPAIASLLICPVVTGIVGNVEAEILAEGQLILCFMDLISQLAKAFSPAEDTPCKLSMLSKHPAFRNTCDRRGGHVHGDIGGDGLIVDGCIHRGQDARAKVDEGLFLHSALHMQTNKALVLFLKTKDAKSSTESTHAL